MFLIQLVVKTARSIMLVISDAFSSYSTPDPAGGACSAPQTPSWISGVLLLREGKLERKGG